MLPISRFAEYCGIFEEENLGLSAIDFYRKIGHTLTYKPYLIADDINYCIYCNLGFHHSFTKEERETFLYIQQLSLLFELDDDVFDIATNRVIRYYAIELSVKESDRSRVAYTIHNAFIRESAHCAVIMFRNYGECMLSVSYGKGGYNTTIYLSDWIDVDSDINYIKRIMAHNLTFLSSISFISDFIYYSAREYYIYPLSKNYFYNRIPNMGISEMGERLDWNAINEFVENGFCYYARIYGDDYVEPEGFDDFQVESIDDFDFDLLELELDEMSDSVVLEESDEFDKDDDFSGDDIDDKKGNQIDISKIDKRILDDPIELLEWIKNRGSEI